MYIFAKLKMTKQVTPYPELAKSKKEQVALMFDNISGRYDFLNRMLSLGIDQIWRRKAIKLLGKNKPKIILDVATGTADFAIQALKVNPDKVIGVDISEGMLAHGRIKLKHKGLEPKIELISGDSEHLPFGANTFDAVTVAFGVRNFENLLAGLTDMNRVTKPNGQAIILEFSKPTVFPIKQIFGFYFKFILPTIGKLISKDQSAYTYLPDSVAAFPEGEEFLQKLAAAGYRNVKQYRLSFGICTIYTGIK